MVRQIAKVCLERAGLVVLEAADGREALEIFEQNVGRIALVVLDLTMPEISGKELYERLRREHDAGLRIILTSGYGPAGGPRASTPDEPTRFLAKPFRPQELIDLVKEMMAR